MKSMKTLLFIVLLIVAGSLSSCGGGGGGGGNSVNVKPACRNLPPLPDTSADYAARLDAFTMARCYDVAQHWKHDEHRRTSQKLHDTLIRMWYSPALFNWMTVQNRKGPVPDGAMVVKEEFPDETSKEDFWSVMVKDSNLWWDGWYWRVVGTEVGAAASVPAAAPSPGACAEPEFGANGPTSINCIGCHASADYSVPGTGTFSPTTFIHMRKKASKGAVAAIASADALPGFAMNATHSQAQAEPNLEEGFTDRLPSSIFEDLRPLATTTIPCMCPSRWTTSTRNLPRRGGLRYSLLLINAPAATTLPTTRRCPPTCFSRRREPRCRLTSRHMANGATR